jgi:hypothetical protein
MAFDQVQVVLRKFNRLRVSDAELREIVSQFWMLTSVNQQYDTQPLLTHPLAEKLLVAMHDDHWSGHKESIRAINDAIREHLPSVDTNTLYTHVQETCQQWVDIRDVPVRRSIDEYPQVPRLSIRQQEVLTALIVEEVKKANRMTHEEHYTPTDEEWETYYHHYQAIIDSVKDLTGLPGKHEGVEEPHRSEKERKNYFHFHFDRLRNKFSWTFKLSLFLFPLIPVIWMVGYLGHFLLKLNPFTKSFKETYHGSKIPFLRDKILTIVHTVVGGHLAALGGVYLLKIPLLMALVPAVKAVILFSTILVGATLALKLARSLGRSRRYRLIPEVEASNKLREKNGIPEETTRALDHLKRIRKANPVAMRKKVRPLVKAIQEGKLNSITIGGDRYILNPTPIGSEEAEQEMHSPGRRRGGSTSRIARGSIGGGRDGLNMGLLRRGEEDHCYERDLIPPPAFAPVPSAPPYSFVAPNSEVGYGGYPGLT